MAVNANSPEFRRVRTPEGAAYYGLPVGSLIKPGAAKAIFKKHADKPEGSSHTLSEAFNDLLGEVGGEGDTGPAPLSGPLLFEVDGESYSAPKGSRLFTNADGTIKYVITPDGHVTPFTKDAQVTLAPALGKSLHAQLTKPGGNEKYPEEQFSKAGLVQQPSGTAAADAPIGTTVVSRNGDFSLTKTETGWEYPAFGIEVDNDTVQGLMDKGDLATPADEPSVDEQAAESDDAMFGDPNADLENDGQIVPADMPPPSGPPVENPPPPSMEEILAVPAPSLDNMPQMQFLATLDAFPDGKVLYAPNDTTYTKGLDGKWTTPSGGKYSNGMMWYVHSALVEENPEDALPEPTLEQVAPKMAEKIKFKKPGEPKGATTPFNTDKSGALASPAPKATVEPSEEALQKALSDGKAAFVSYLDSLPGGSTLFYLQGESVVEYTKDAQGSKWETSEDEYGPGSLFYLDPNGLSHADPLLPTSAKDAVQVIPEGKMIAHADIVAAIDGLEGHSGFQVAYGLKGLPDSNPFKDAGFQNQIKDYASEAFPDLKPKPAFVAYLKQKAGVAAPAEEEKASGPKNITVGSASPKNVGVQGYDGGQFSEQDITEAIAILEDFQGKAFKAALNKKGNALGTLDPTKIVGFDKDKTVMKDKFLALLKTKVSTPEVAPEPESTPDEFQAPGLTADEVSALPKGTTFSFEDKGHVGIWEKTGDGEWTLKSSTDPKAADSVGVHSSGDFVISSWTEDGDPYVLTEPQAPQKPTLEHLEIAGDGSTMNLVWDGIDHVFTKQGDFWNDGDSNLGTKGFKILMDSNGTTVEDITIYPKSAPMEVVPDPVIAPPLETNNPTLLDLIAAPKWKAVIQVTDGVGKVTPYVKHGETGLWIEALDAGGEPIDAGTSNGLNNADMHEIATAPGSGAYLAQANPEASKPAYAQTPAAAQKIEAPAPKTEGEFYPGDVQKAPVGTFVAVFDSSGGGQSHRLEKTSEDVWKFIETTDPDQEIGEVLSGVEMEAYVNHKNITTSFDAPESDFVSSYKAEQDGKKSKSAAANAPKGLVAHLMTNDKNAIAKVVGPDDKNSSIGLPGTAGTWIVNTEHGKPVEVMTAEQYAAFLDTQPNWAIFYDGAWNYSPDGMNAQEQQEASVKTNPSGLEPGKYISGGKAYMIVKADGKGVYVDSKGTVTALTVAKVKSNYAAGMDSYQGQPDSIPSVTPVKAKKPASVDKIPDGVYFSGDPNDIKTPVYTVSGDTVTIVKPKTSTMGSDSKVGSKVDTTWLTNASVGASFIYQGIVYRRMTSDGGKDDWVSNDGKTLQDFSWGQVTSYYGYKAKVNGHGPQEPAEVPLTKAKTLFATGKFVDLNGNSVVPEGYSGAVMFFGGQTTMPALIKAKALLETNPEVFTQKEINQLATLGVKVNISLLKKKTLADAVEGNGQGGAYYKILSDQIEAFTEGIEVEEPEGDAAEFFTFNGQGEAVFPADLATMSLYSKPEKNAWIKYASLSVGDGKIIGLNPVKMSADEADSWITAFRQGNFTQIYTLDVNASTKPGAKPLLEGYKHPGSPENETTHKVAWQPAVEGEISALKDVPGNWTALNVQASMAEIDNYLIAAQMQNPTFLTNSEKRTWVQRHRQANKSQVDHLSVLAKQRADSGATPASDPIAWTDNVKPAKSYDSLFDDTIHPTGSWSGQTATDYYDEHAEHIPDLKSTYDASVAAGEYFYNDTYRKQAIVERYFEAEKEKAYQISLIPVYTKKPIQTVKQGTHPISQWTDQWGNEFFFKPRPKGMEFRADIEALGNGLGRFWGYDSATPTIKTGNDALDGAYYGLLMKGVPAVGDLMGVDFSTLSGKQIGDIASEHVLDWMLDNDDTKGDNALITPDGKIVGIDKGRTFVSYGHWDGLNPNGMNTNANVVYGNMLKAVAAGKISKETADAAYLQMQKRIKRIQKSDSEAMAAMVTDAMKHRDKGYKVPYSIDGKQVPQTLDGLLMAIEHRKANLNTDFENLWATTYKQAGYGDLPEIPLKAVDGVISGFDDPDLTGDVLKAKSHSKSTLVGGAHVHGGDVQIWTDKTPDGQMNVEGRMFLSFRAQDEMLTTLKNMATPEVQTESGVFPTNLDIYWNPFFVAAKTVNHHSADGQYNAASIAAWEEKEKALNADLLAWSPDLKTTKINGVEMVAFPSGTSVPKQQMGQYKMMLDHYVTQSAAIRKGYEEKAKIIPHIEQYKSVEIKPNEYFTSADGQSTAVKLGNGQWLVTYYLTGAIETHADGAEVMADIKANWVQATKDKPDTKGFAVVLKNQTHENPASIGDDGVKSIKSETQHAGTGAKGQEYEITLPTGEKIYYRNYGQTNTVRSQSGMLSFRAKGAGGNDSDMATSFERVQAALEALGVSTAAAEEDDAQNIYWREMHDLFMHRNGNGATKAHQGFQSDILTKRKEILKGADEKYFLEDLTASFGSAAEEAAWWRDLYSKHFGAEVINKVVTERSYLPKFDHFNMDDAELETGHPYWIRFDMTLESIRQTGKILGSTSSQEPVYKVKSGGNLGAEERFRLTGQWADGMSATSDQGYGSAHNVYTRVQGMGGGSYSGYRTFYDPAAMLRTRTYSFDSDNFGRLDNRKGSSPMDPSYALKNFTAGGNETMLPHGASLLDTIEMYVFENATKRQEAIDFLKKRNIEIIRGLPVEDRLVMRTSLSAAMAKVKASWTK